MVSLPSRQSHEQCFSLHLRTFICHAQPKKKDIVADTTIIDIPFDPNVLPEDEDGDAANALPAEKDWHKEHLVSTKSAFTHLGLSPCILSPLKIKVPVRHQYHMRVRPCMPATGHVKGAHTLDVCNGGSGGARPDMQAASFVAEQKLAQLILWT